MRVGIVGTGLAGCALAWRLHQLDPSTDIELVAGAAASRGVLDASAASGGLMRGFEPNAAACADAAASFAELLDDPALLRCSGFRTTGSLYVTPAAGAGALASEVERLTNAPVRVLAAAELDREFGLRSTPDDYVGVVEPRAGYLSAAALRAGLLSDLAVRGVRVVELPFDRVSADMVGGLLADGRPVSFDVLVLATGPWTPRLLARSGLPTRGWRTKAIQYGVHRCSAEQPPAFVDDVTGLYGRPNGDREVLLGLPSEHWDVDADHPAPDERLAGRVITAVTERLPGLIVGARVDQITSADAYHERPGLALRPIAGRPGVHTFSGGSGGAAKTVLAASRRAAQQIHLTDPVGASAQGEST